MRMLFVAFFVVLSAPSSLWAASKVGRPLSMTGYLHCPSDREPKTDGSCDLKFTSLEDGETYEIVDSPALTREHCQTHKPIKARVMGQLTFRMLFHDDHLKVDDAQMLGEYTAPAPHREVSAAAPARTHPYDRRP